MSQPWRDAVAALAGADGVLTIVDGAEWEATFVAEVVVPNGFFRGRGDDEEGAWRVVAHTLGDFLLLESLEAAGWTDIDEVIDEVTYVVARDPDGALWAIGVATAGSHRRGYIETDIEFDDRVFDRVAFVEPLDTRDARSLLAALEATS